MTKRHLFLLGFLFMTLYVSAQVHWTKYEQNPVHNWGSQPTVLLDNDTLKMWFAFGATDSLSDSLGYIIVTGYATSPDGIEWTDYPSNPVLDVPHDSCWDSRVHDTPFVLKDSSGYKMWFTGADHIGYPWIDSLVLVLGFAESDDGVHWQKYQNPVLLKGGTGSWERLWLESPTVIYDEGIYKMWYTGVSTETGLLLGQVGYATSSDGINWEKYPENPVLTVGSAEAGDDKIVGVCSVLKKGDLYYMWYSSISQADTNQDTIRLNFAYSFDGISWAKYAENPIMTPFYPSIDGDTIAPWAPAVIYKDSIYMMWYEGICLATAPDDFPFPENISSIPKKFEVYPNPVKNIIYVSEYSEIYDLTGRKITDLTKGRNNVSFLPSGIYLLHTETGKVKTIVKK